jgi:hypothetical protein
MSRSDAFGRMTGSFTYEEESVQPDHRKLAHYESDLQDVYLLPDWLSAGATTVRSGAPEPRVDNDRRVQAMTVLPVIPRLRPNVLP